MTDGHFFEDPFVGQTAALSRKITDVDILMYAAVSMNTNPVHLDEGVARRLRFGGRMVHGMLSAGLVSAVPGTHLPGPGAIYTRRMLNFRAPVRIGSIVRAVVEIIDLNPLSKKATLKTTCMVKEEVVIDGQACVLVPSRA
jgi:3-hydroxybutyryl-CoA dehydratase